jgi:organic radical activating enzyme
MTQAEVLDRVLALDDSPSTGIDRVVITGGEPMLQRVGLGPLLTMLHRNGIYVEVETNGTLTPTDHLLDVVDQWNVSPKLPHSGVDQAKAWKPDTLRALADTNCAVLKVVCQTAADVDLLCEMIENHRLPFEPSEVWVMPEGVNVLTIETHAQWIAEAAIARGYNLTTRLHVSVWGNKRGV